MPRCTRQKCFVVCGHQCQSSNRYVVSIECKICVLYTKLHKHITIHLDWVLLDAEKDVCVCRQCACLIWHFQHPWDVWWLYGWWWRWREVNLTFVFTSVSKIRAVYKAERELPEIHGFKLNSYWLLVSLGESYSHACVNITFICV
jgi:hypothetical protein